MNLEEIEVRVDNAIDLLFENDTLLLDYDVNERTITHKLAEYLQQQFEGWHVDCEYNRDLKKPKQMPLPRDEINWDDTESKTVFPDIIVHHRETSDNLLVIEVKKSSNNYKKDFDEKKLTKFTEPELFSYMYGLYLELPVPSLKEKIIKEWYRNGKVHFKEFQV